MWHQKSTLISVVVGDLGAVKKDTNKIFTTDSWNVKTNRNPENCTNRRKTNSELVHIY